MKRIATPGADPRMIRAAKALCREGWSLVPEGEAADLILCPPGWKEDKLRPLAHDLLPGGTLVTGTVAPGLAALCEEKGARALALMDDPYYRRSNARATAEGTLGEALRLLPRNLRGERVLVLGYGACGSEIARLFAAVGCAVSVWSHPGSLARAAGEGFAQAKAAELPAFSLVINTVPAPDFMPILIDRLSPGTVFLQVASGEVPGGEPLAARGVSCHPLPGLPGRYAPESEALAVLSALSRRLQAADSRQPL